jgi:hypothetical protein
VNNTNRFKAIAYAIALFFLGGVIGAEIMYRVMPNPQSLRVGRTDEIEARIMERLNAKLDLTPEQKTRLKPMIKKAAAEMEAAHLDCLKRVGKTAVDLDEQIKPELVKEQVEKLAELEADRARRMKEKYNFETASNTGPH